MRKWLYNLIFIKWMKWKITGYFPPELKQCVLMVMPHTSWHDFYLGVFTRAILGLDMHFIAKKELFRFPLGGYFRWMGGEPLDRTGGLNKVEAMAAIFKRKEIFRVAIAPEGTRKKVTELKSGFYYIALSAGVPIVPVAFDFEHKEVRFGEAFWPTGNYKEELPILLKHFEHVKGKVAEYSYEVPR
jgi:1-acyl-sn-glycerol-3-phosphate acyltransferase